jgi:catechol 2,3-dioxygenase-like lactoylglutathione lyase family enzyme
MRLSQVTLFVRDLEASLRFYRDGLGLEPVVSSPRFVQLRPGGSAERDGCLLALHASDDHPERVSRCVNLHYEVDDLTVVRAACERRGVRFEGEPRREPWGAWTLRATDPDGNRVELVRWGPAAGPGA